MAFKIYTKTGDKGETALLGGTRVPKHHIRIEAYGTVDELNSWIGQIRDSVQPEFEKELYEIQNYLFTVGSHLATTPAKELKMSLPDLETEQITFLEERIDFMEETLPALTNFVLPGGDVSASKIHIARCVCRRAERISVALSSSEEIDQSIVQYLNRLSDYLFVLSRYVLKLNGGTEVIWDA
jgi:cob(I)alamin adenosyltransferase